MAEKRPWMFPSIPGLNVQTQLYTSRKSDAETPKEYKYTIETLLNFLVSQFGVTRNAALEGYRQLFQNHQTTTLVWTENGGNLPINTSAFVFVFEAGRKLTEGIEYSISANIFTLNYPISSANYEIIIHQLTTS